MKFRAGLMVLLGLWLCLPAQAEEAGQHYNRVNLQVEEGRDVDNDQLTVLLNAEEENRDAAELAARINAIMHAALQQVRQVPAVRASSGSYQIRPVYDSGSRLKRWRGSQSLQLRSTDVTAISQLVGRLQEQLKVKSMLFSVTPEHRQEVETQLTDAALDAFGARAQRVAGRLGFSGYRIVSLNITNQGERVRPMLMRDMAMAESRAPMAVEGGQSRIAVVVHGAIELVK